MRGLAGRQPYYLIQPYSAPNQWGPPPRFTWVAASHELFKSAVYLPAILDAVRATPPGVELEPLTLPESYMQEAGAVARKRIIMAGVRLATLLKNSQ